MVRPPAAHLHVREVVAQGGDSLGRQREGQGLHERVGHGGAGSVAKHQEARGVGRLDHDPGDGRVTLAFDGEVGAARLGVALLPPPHHAIP